jgi:type IV secretory pathway VirD2 relaxase
MRCDCPKDSKNIGLRCSRLDTSATTASLVESTDVITANFRTRHSDLVELAHGKEEKVESNKSQQFPSV